MYQTPSPTCGAALRPSMGRSVLATVFLASAVLGTTPGLASEPLSGFFIATERCEAFQSKNKKTNPGTVFTVKDRAYPLFALNKRGGTYFQIKVRGAPVTESRWVRVSCGQHVVAVDTPTSDTDDASTTSTASSTPSPGAESETNLLALSWQPAFCEKKPNKTECKALNNGRLPITETQLSLHGLWPQPRGNDYCGVSNGDKKLDRAKRWQALKPLDLTPTTRAALDVAMPGTASFLHRHEWIKHGTCFRGKGGAEEYYADTLLVLDAINRSAVGRFLAARVGKETDTMDIRAQFDAAFGDGAGARVQFHCAGDGQRVLLQGVRIQLKGIIAPNVPVGDLMRNADATSLGCPKGVIDPAGLQ